MRSKENMKMAKKILIGLIAAAAMALGPAGVASANVQWDIKTTWGPTELRPGGEALFALTVRNRGTTESTGEVKIVDHLPQGVSIKEPFKASEYTQISGGPFTNYSGEPFGYEGWTCFGLTTLTCKTNAHMPPWYGSAARQRIQFLVSVAPDASGTHSNFATMSGLGSDPVTDVDPITIGNGPEKFGFIPESVDGDAYAVERPLPTVERQAGGHPFEIRSDFDFNELMGLAPPPLEGTPEDRIFTKPIGRVRTIQVILPRGMIGDPEAVPQCKEEKFLEYAGAGLEGAGCPPDTQIGQLRVQLSDGWGDGGWGFINEFPRVGIYNLVPPKGVAADFGFKVGGVAVGHIYQTLDPAHYYAVKATSPFITDLIPIRGIQATLWGVPGDPAHDPVRIYQRRCDPVTLECEAGPQFGAHVDPPYQPLLKMPMDCGVDNGPFLFSADSWNNPGKFTTPLPGVSGDVNVTGCDDQRVRFHPHINLQPTDRSAGAPTGLDVHLEVEQRDQTVNVPERLYPETGQLHGVDTPPMKKVVTTFPEGMTISTSAAQGLGVCSSAQLALGTNDPVTCPDNSQYGTLTLHTPILPPDQPMRGFIYIAKKGDNPYNNFLSMYFVIQEPQRDLLIKIPGKLDLDPVTGQIKVTFDDLPQFPLSDMQLTFKGGLRSALGQPRTCGKKVITADFYSWADPNTPHRVSSSYDITHRSDGSPCVNDLKERPFDVSMSAGTVNPNAASFSPFIFRMQRSDDDQELSQIVTQLPPGLTARIADKTLCSDEAIEAAANPRRTGTEEAESPSCPATSLVGTTEVGSGVGVPLTYIRGRIYLAGPYKGAPLSIAVINPILPGPYDLGNIVVRSAVYVDRSTTAVKVATDPFPQIYQGIPVRIRDIRLKIDRDETILNPTNCDPTSIGAHLTGAGGDVNTTADDTASDLSEPFQVANCLALPFKPRLSFRLRGGTSRGDHPALSATLVGKPGNANLRKVQVTLPPSTFIDQGHIRTVCTRVQYAADECPQGSIYGFAKAWTPLLDQPVEGPLILRSSSHLLPDLVMDLRGQVNVSVVGRIDSINGRNRTTFEGIPDQPVSKFQLVLQGGGKGLLVNAKDLCGIGARATVLIDGQNGLTADQFPAMRNGCAGERARKARHHRHRSRHRRVQRARKAG
jgi:uncharacterized repeat protein (TIGR01451 family)